MGNVAAVSRAVSRAYTGTRRDPDTGSLGRIAKVRNSFPLVESAQRAIIPAPTSPLTRALIPSHPVPPIPRRCRTRSPLPGRVTLWWFLRGNITWGAGMSFRVFEM